jgi:organic radical activating enzyme
MEAVHPAPQGEGLGLAIVSATAAERPARYLSCRFLERAVTFYPGQVTACCANPATGQTPVIAPFEGSLSAEALMEGRARIIERHMRGDIVPECQGCPRLTELEWNEAQLGPAAIDEVTVAHFSSCNIRCNYCYTVTNPELTAPLSKSPKILPVFQELIERKLLARYATVRFSGGEPMLSPEFEPLLELLTNYGVRSVIYTNATKRSEAIMEALRRDKVELILGIDAASSEVYKAIKKMNYNEKVWKVVAEYCATIPPNAANKVWAKFIFCLENYHEAEFFVRRAEAAGAKYVYYDFDASRARSGLERHGQGLPDEVADYAALLRHECGKRGIAVDFAQAGMAWLTPERTERMEREMARLNGVAAMAACS